MTQNYCWYQTQQPSGITTFTRKSFFYMATKRVQKWNCNSPFVVLFWTFCVGPIVLQASLSGDRLWYTDILSQLGYFIISRTKSHVNAPPNILDTLKDFINYSVSVENVLITLLELCSKQLHFIKDVLGSHKHSKCLDRTECSFQPLCFHLGISVPTPTSVR